MENLERTDEGGASNRSFGLVFAAVFLLIGIGPFFVGHSPHWWSIAVGLAFGVAALAVPALLAPANKLWARFGALLHRIVSPVVLGIMFFAVITPMGVVMRALGKDPLRLRRDSDAATYWIDRVPPGPPPETFVDQF